VNEAHDGGRIGPADDDRYHCAPAVAPTAGTTPSSSQPRSHAVAMALDQAAGRAASPPSRDAIVASRRAQTVLIRHGHTALSPRLAMAHPLRMPRVVVLDGWLRDPRADGRRGARPGLVETGCRRAGEDAGQRRADDIQRRSRGQVGRVDGGDAEPDGDEGAEAIPRLRREAHGRLDDLQDEDDERRRARLGEQLS